MSISVKLNMFVALPLTHYSEPLMLDLQQSSATHPHGLPPTILSLTISQIVASCQLATMAYNRVRQVQIQAHLVKREAEDPPVSIAQRACKHQRLLVIQLTVTVNTTLTSRNITSRTRLSLSSDRIHQYSRSSISQAAPSGQVRRATSRTIVIGSIIPQPVQSQSYNAGVYLRAA